MNKYEMIYRAEKMIHVFMNDNYDKAIDIYNEYCEAINKGANTIISIEWLDLMDLYIAERFSKCGTSQLLYMMLIGDVKPTDKYIWIETVGGKSFFKSGNDPLNSDHFNLIIHKIATYIIEHRDNLNYEEFDVLFETEDELISECEQFIKTMINNHDLESVVRMQSDFISRQKHSDFMPIGFLNDTTDVEEFFYDYTMWDVMELILEGKVDMKDDYIWFEKDENSELTVVSGNNPFDNKTHENDIHAMAEYIIKHRDSLDNDDMNEFLNECSLI